MMDDTSKFSRNPGLSITFQAQNPVGVWMVLPFFIKNPKTSIVQKKNPAENQTPSIGGMGKNGMAQCALD